MKKMIWAVFLCLFLAGCHRTQEAQRVRVVTEVTVSKDSQTVCSYIAPEKMSVILNYLRLLRSKLPAPAEAELEEAPVYSIILHHSDGSETFYRQKGNRYMQTGSEGWKTIDPRYSWALETILKLMPPDG